MRLFDPFEINRGKALKTCKPEICKKCFQFSKCSKIENALKKQIPKKAIGVYDENIYQIGDDDYIYEPARFGTCPSCNQEVQDGMSFCSFCGQALDWSE